MLIHSIHFSPGQNNIPREIWMLLEAVKLTEIHWQSLFSQCYCSNNGAKWWKSIILLTAKFHFYLFPKINAISATWFVSLLDFFGHILKGCCGFLFHVLFWQLLRINTLQSVTPRNSSTELTRLLCSFRKFRDLYTTIQIQLLHREIRELFCQAHAILANTCYLLVYYLPVIILGFFWLLWVSCVTH